MHCRRVSVHRMHSKILRESFLGNCAQTFGEAPEQTPARLHRRCPRRCPLSCCPTPPSCSSSSAPFLCVCASSVSSSGGGEKLGGQRSRIKQHTLHSLHPSVHLLLLLVFVLLLVLVFLLLAPLLVFVLLFSRGRDGGGTSCVCGGKQQAALTWICSKLLKVVGSNLLLLDG